MVRLNSELGVAVSDSLEASVGNNVRVVLVAVKPQIIGSVLDSLSNFIQKDSLLISIAAGISTTQLLDRLGNDKRVIRAMPNAAAMVGQSATALCKGRYG